jgi:hypothetical protein
MLSPKSVAATIHTSEGESWGHGDSSLVFGAKPFRQKKMAPQKNQGICCLKMCGVLLGQYLA